MVAYPKPKGRTSPGRVQKGYILLPIYLCVCFVDGSLGWLVSTSEGPTPVMTKNKLRGIARCAGQTTQSIHRGGLHV